MTPKVFQRRLGALMKRCPEFESPRWKAWKREWDDFLYVQCDRTQASTALDLYELHALNEDLAF